MRRLLRRWLRGRANCVLVTHTIGLQRAKALAVRERLPVCFPVGEGGWDVVPPEGDFVVRVVDAGEGLRR